ncbi:MAG TPA: superoxide dismutase family protein [Casimicrobiaceae bacterium]|jgi:Cu-Zn family superoxide dismutase|nr:superoxide dismutase family protein [Casimicrobiaceae bacterium]
MTVRPSQLLACAIAVSVAGLVLGACTINTPVMAAIAPATGNQAHARLAPKNGSITYGTVLFTQRGDKVAVLAQVFNLSGGPHSFYIHETGNCSSPNAASAGPVWNINGSPPGARRTGELPNIVVRHEDYTSLEAQVVGLSVGSGAANDVTGHSVVVHGKLDPDPKPEFGVINDWLACGVIEKF